MTNHLNRTREALRGILHQAQYWEVVTACEKIENEEDPKNLKRLLINLRAFISLKKVRLQFHSTIFLHTKIKNIALIN